MNEIRDGVLREFYALTEIPRPSGHEEQVSSYLTGRLRAWGLQPETDAAHNIICDVPATPGQQDKVRIALQAHMDMVCVGAPDYRPEQDRIVTQLKDGWLCTDGRSSLGADCGIGLAASLYLVSQGCPDKSGAPIAPDVPACRYTAEGAGAGVKAGTAEAAGDGVKAGTAEAAGDGVKAGTAEAAGDGVKAGTAEAAGAGVKAGTAEDGRTIPLSSHGPLRLIFTVDEERGLAGAKKLPEGCLEGCGALINLDSFHFGELLVSSAGGLRQTFTKQPELFFPMLEKPVRLSVTGLKGGHSGDDIGDNRANAAQLLVWLLQSLQVPYELAAISAGRTHNAIPAQGYAVICIDPQYEAELKETAALFLSGIQELYPAEAIQLTLSDAEKPAWVYTVDERDNLLALAGLLLCGEAARHPLFPEITGSSGSMGMLQADPERIEIRSFLRSVSQTFLEEYRDFYALAAHGFRFETASEAYPAWPGLESDWLTGLFLQEGKRLGIPQHKNAVHVGLETSILHALAPELPMVCVGMEIEGAHSVGERVRLDTIEPFTRLLAAVLAAAPEVAR